LLAPDAYARVSVICFTGSEQRGLSLSWHDRRWRAGLRVRANPMFLLRAVFIPRASAS